MSVDPGEYRQAMGRFATGVTVVTTFSSAGTEPRDHAMTANSLTSVSLDPVLLLLSAQNDGRWLEAARECGVWGVSVLGASARAHAQWLATPGRPEHGQLDRVPHHRGAATGVALLDGAIAELECRTRDIHPAGDHSLIVAEVLSVHTPSRAEAALVHYRGRWDHVE